MQFDKKLLEEEAREKYRKNGLYFNNLIFFSIQAFISYSVRARKRPIAEAN